MFDFKFDLGAKVSDRITGYEGIIVGRSQWLTNCNTYGVKSQQLKDGKPMEPEWFDELNAIEEIELRVSCEGHSQERVSYIVFRLKDQTRDDEAEAIAEKLGQQPGLYSLGDTGAENRPRIVVAGKTWYGEKDWASWWSSLAEKVAGAVRAAE